MSIMNNKIENSDSEFSDSESDSEPISVMNWMNDSEIDENEETKPKKTKKIKINLKDIQKKNTKAVIRVKTDVEPKKVKKTKKNVTEVKVKTDAKKDVAEKKKEYKPKFINKHEYYYTQQKALSQDGSILFKYGEKLFSKAEDLTEFLKLVKKSSHPMFLEICNKNVKMMADLEQYKFTDHEMMKYLNELLTDVFDRLGFEFEAKKAVYLVDDSKKKSMHFIYDSGVCFKNNGERTADTTKHSQWEFWEFVKGIVFKEPKYEHLRVWVKQDCGNGSKYSTEKSVIDFAVYSKNRAMRIMKSYKCTKAEVSAGKVLRTFHPCKIEENKVILLKNKKITKKYLINDYSGKPIHYEFDIKLPETKIKSLRFNIDEVCDIINKKLKDIEPVTNADAEGCMIKLRNKGERKCEISGDKHEGNNAYVVWRPNGLFFYCHWEACKDTPLDHVEPLLTEDGGYMFHKSQVTKKSALTKIKKALKKPINESDVKEKASIYVNDLVYSDINRLLPRLRTESIRMNKKEILEDDDDETTCTKTLECLTPDSRQDLLDWMKGTIVYITDSGIDSFYIKKRMYDAITRVTTITWMRRNAEKIFNCRDSLHSSGAQFSPGLNVVTLGKLIQVFTCSMMDNEFIVPRYDACSFIPYYKDKPDIQYTFNLFEGWYLQKLIDDESEEESRNLESKSSEDDIDFEKTDMYKHVKENICNGDEKLFKYTQSFIAHMIQKPQEITEVCLVLYSQGGAGKDRFSAFLGALIGSMYHGVYSSLDAFTGNFNVLNKNKLLCTLNEVSDKASRKVHDLLKHIFTQDHERIELKGLDAETFPCFKRYIINTNYRDCVRVETDDRRYVLYQMNNKQIGDFEFFKRISDEINDLPFLKSAFKYYGSFDISKFNTRAIPKTDYKTNQQMMNVKSSYQFMMQLCKTDDLDSDFGEKIHEHSTDPDMKPEEEEVEDNTESNNVMDALDDESSDNEADEPPAIYSNNMFKRPNTERHDYEFKIKDLYNIYKFFCEDSGINVCKTPSFKQDMLSLGLGDGRKGFRATNRIYGKKSIRGYIIKNDDLKKRLETELNMKLD